jgi:hypothetical protein
VPPKCAHPAVRNDNVPPKRGMDRRLVATTPRADTLDFGLWSCYTVIPCPRLRGGRRETEKVIERRRRVCVFITAGPITKLFAGGEEESGGLHDVRLVKAPGPTVFYHDPFEQ